MFQIWVTPHGVDLTPYIKNRVDINRFLTLCQKEHEAFNEKDPVQQELKFKALIFLTKRFFIHNENDEKK